MSAQSGSRKAWKYAEQAKDFHAAHSYAPYSMAFNEAIERMMEDKRFPPQLRVVLAGIRLAWGNLADSAQDGYPKVDAGDPEPRRLNQRAVAERIGIPESTFSEVATFLRRENYWKSPTDSVYPDDQQQPKLFASVRAGNPNKNLERHGGVNSGPGETFAVSSPTGKRYQEEWNVGHEDKLSEVERLRAERKRHREAIRECSAKIRAIEHQKLKWVTRRLAEMAAEAAAAKAPAQGSKPGSTEEHTAGAVRDTPGDQFATPADPVRTPHSESRTPRMQAPVNGSAVNADDASLLSFNLEKESGQAAAAALPLTKEPPPPPPIPSEAQPCPDLEATAEAPDVLEAGLIDRGVHLSAPTLQSVRTVLSVEGSKEHFFLWLDRRLRRGSLGPQAPWVKMAHEALHEHTRIRARERQRGPQRPPAAAPAIEPEPETSPQTLRQQLEEVLHEVNEVQETIRRGGIPTDRLVQLKTQLVSAKRRRDILLRALPEQARGGGA